MTSGSGSSTGLAHSTVTPLPHTFTFPLISQCLACAADFDPHIQGAEPPTLLFVIGLMIENNVHQTLCDFTELFQNIFLNLILRNGSNKKSLVCRRNAQLPRCLP
ncbi:hypothetical protein P7K49_028951, partial [Saguinus oedipus]